MQGAVVCHANVAVHHAEQGLSGAEATEQQREAAGEPEPQPVAGRSPTDEELAERCSGSSSTRRRNWICRPSRSARPRVSYRDRAEHTPKTPQTGGAASPHGGPGGIGPILRARPHASRALTHRSRDSPGGLPWTGCR